MLPTLPRHRLQQLVQDVNLQPLVRKKVEAIPGPVYASW